MYTLFLLWFLKRIFPQSNAFLYQESTRTCEIKLTCLLTILQTDLVKKQKITEKEASFLTKGNFSKVMSINVK